MDTNFKVALDSMTASMEYYNKLYDAVAGFRKRSGALSTAEKDIIRSALSIAEKDAVTKAKLLKGYFNPDSPMKEATLDVAELEVKFD